ncbi:redoxin domain-containing protein [Methanoculleus sp.]|jgi:alkyl hydroperoxide reductase subunit AhpC|uniref:Putative peroxiredoxin n=1 Tax=Methanoculleus marisnigri TaxID=2198 RepID=A0A117MFA1_9EURY|nr:MULTISPECIES: redoxin domain-containing protein [Methanoculleus]KUK60575.1 MAG: putative peroxiredoxin [Methanoculleus marisnigri]KUL00853.1 MAG: putative peroxiredoxin [Methanoculleus marisnigri]
MPVIGEKAPEFDALTTHRPLKLSDLAGKWVILRLTKALQTPDKHGVATLANWEAGEKVIVPAPKTPEEIEKRMNEGYECKDWCLCCKQL